MQSDVHRVSYGDFKMLTTDDVCRTSIRNRLSYGMCSRDDVSIRVTRVPRVFGQPEASVFEFR